MEKLTGSMPSPIQSKTKAEKVNPVVVKQVDETVKKVEVKNDAKVEISERAKELKAEFDAAKKVEKIHSKKFGNKEEPAIYFVSGFDWFGAGSIKGNYDGIRDMAEAVTGAQHYSWDEQDEVIEDIMKHKSSTPLVLVGHSFGGDGVMEIAERLNTIENGFRKVDLLVTLDSVGYDNDKVPQNVKRNLNYLAQGPYDFLNDGPNIAENYQRTEVENFLRKEEHADLDDNTEIQMTVLEEIDKVLDS